MRPAAVDAMALAAVGLLAVALGWIVVRYDGFEAGIGPAILMIAAGAGSLALIMSWADRLPGGDRGAHRQWDPATAR